MRVSSGFRFRILGFRLGFRVIRDVFCFEFLVMSFIFVLGV